MAIALRGTGTVGPNSNGTSTSISLPSGVTAGDVSIINFIQCSSKLASGTIQTLTPPAGWTALYNYNGCVICYRVYQAGDPTSGISCSSTEANWWESACVAYSGCDASPIDQFKMCVASTVGGTFGNKRNKIEAPSVQAAFNAGMYVGCFAKGGPGTSGNTVGTPSGLTSRAGSNNGPVLKICDLALTDGTPTGPYTASITAQDDVCFGGSIILKASGASAATAAAARPILGGFHQKQLNVNTFTLPLEYLDVQDQDLLLFCVDSPDTVTSVPSGFSLVANSVSGSAVAYSKIWSTGDSKTPAFNFSGTNYKDMTTALFRKSGVSASNVSIDQSGSNSSTGSGARTVSPPSMTPANAAELLFLYWGTAGAASGAWSSQPTLTVFEEAGNANTPCNVGYVLPASSPTGTINDTWTRGAGSDTLTAFGVLLTVGGAAGAGAGKSNFLAF